MFEYEPRGFFHGINVPAIAQTGQVLQGGRCLYWKFKLAGDSDE